MEFFCPPTFKLRVPDTIGFLLKNIRTGLTFQTRDQSHASEMCTPIADGLQLILIRDGLCILGVHVFSSIR